MFCPHCLAPSLLPSSVPHILLTSGESVYQILSLEAHRATAANSVPKEIQPLGPAVIGYMLSHVGSLTYPEPQTFLESQEAYGLLRIEFLNA